MEITPFKLAQRYVGIREIPGADHHPLIQFWLSLCDGFGLDSPDEIPWCSAFPNGIFWELRMDRSKSARARSWLLKGISIPLEEAEPGFDLVILKRGPGEQPGPEVIDAPAHVGFFAGLESGFVRALGGNQSNEINISPFPKEKIIGIRRII